MTLDTVTTCQTSPVPLAEVYLPAAGLYAVNVWSGVDAISSSAPTTGFGIALRFEGDVVCGDQAVEARATSWWTCAVEVERPRTAVLTLSSEVDGSVVTIDAGVTLVAVPLAGDGPRLASRSE